MNRLAAAAAAVLVLGGCVAQDRVTLLSHSDGGPVGSLAVLDENDREIAELDGANQQARLSRSGASVRQLEAADPAHTALIGSLPPGADGLVLTGFATGVSALTDAQLRSVRAHMCKVEFRAGCETYFPQCTDPANQGPPACPVPRPGYQVEIRGYTDSDGGEPRNLTVAQQRADAVANAMRAAGYVVADEDVLGMGEFEARRANGDGVKDDDWRRVDIVIR